MTALLVAAAAVLIGSLGAAYCINLAVGRAYAHGESVGYTAGYRDGLTVAEEGAADEH